MIKYLFLYIHKIRWRMTLGTVFCMVIKKDNFYRVFKFSALNVIKIVHGFL